MKANIIAVTLEQPGTDDLKEITVRTDNRDMVRWELIASRKGWPAATAAPVLSLSVMAYSALLRAGEVQGTENVETFLDRCVGARFVNEDGSAVTLAQVQAGDVGTNVDPSQPAAAPGY